jgi:hypothetical protein
MHQEVDPNFGPYQGTDKQGNMAYKTIKYSIVLFLKIIFGKTAAGSFWKLTVLLSFQPGSFQNSSRPTLRRNRVYINESGQKR